jgi:uncharacterized membrane protein
MPSWGNSTSPQEGPVFRFLTKNFLRGLLVIVPAAATIWLLWCIFIFVDDQLIRPPSREWTIPFTEQTVPGIPIDVPGAGVLLTVIIVTAVGLLASNVATRWLFVRSERLFTHLPGVKLLYSSIKDLIKAFVSDQKKFDKPVLLSLGDSAPVEVIGFITRENLDELGISDRVAVYVPQSYNFAANLILVPPDRVRPLDLPAGDVMAFVVSGGVASMPEREPEEEEVGG